MSVDPLTPDDPEFWPAAGEGAGCGAPREGAGVRDLFSGAARETTSVDAPAALCRACVDLMDITGASVSLGREDPDVRMLWWSSGPVAARLAEAQYTLGDGPCRTVLTDAAPAFAEDLANGSDAARWPVFAEQALELGVRAVFSLPLRDSAFAIGTLDLYRDIPGPLSDRDRSFAFSAADAITTALLAIDAQDLGRDSGNGTGAAGDVAAEHGRGRGWSGRNRIMRQFTRPLE
ncbi:hypothetical protein Slala05_81620 [Streptomyces lavendulae subsp. lavendulae]|nr:hypothetical protein Slala05_81620 [Streptomyces lavendulae subsp. lavendulae]